MTGLPQTIYFDGTRLVSRSRFSTPTGIDRVDLAYLQALASAESIDLRIVMRSLFGIRTLSQHAGQQLVHDAVQRWARPLPESAEPTKWAALQQWLESPASSPRPRFEVVVTTADEPRSTPPAADTESSMPSESLILSAAAAALRRPIYVNTSHGQLFRPAYRRWLQRTGLRGLFFVHDLIPLSHPEYSRAREPARHAARLELIATFAACVLANSEATRTELVEYWRQRGVKAPPISVAPLGVSLPRQALPPPQPAVPYFVMLGTIEPRKNHALLLEIWRKLAEADPIGAPRLVIAGRRGWLNQAVFDLLDRSPSLAGHVVECGGLTDVEIIALLLGARALLNPSFAEGFGLPVAEALASGVPAIVSDLPAHREVGGVFAEYIGALDHAGWLQAIQDYSHDSDRRQWAIKHVADFRPPTWKRHFEIVASELSKLE